VTHAAARAGTSVAEQQGKGVFAMAKGKTKTTTKGMHGGKDRKTKGRTSISGSSMPGDDVGPRASKPNVPQVVRREANRPVKPGGGKHRGDRRDMNRVYTNNQRHSSRGNNVRTDVSTRKR
jgi:hypothetical protein